MSATSSNTNSDQSASSVRLQRLAPLSLPGVILLANIFLHCYQLSATPGLDPQEGYNLDIAWNLAHGRLQLFALAAAFGQHPPLFYLQLVASIHLFGYNIVSVRALAAFYAILTCASLLILGWRMLGTGPALWATTVYTVAPVMLANTRWGYSYAQLAFVGMLCLGAAWVYQQHGERRWLVLAALCAGLATLSDYEGIAWVFFVALVALWPSQQRWNVRWRRGVLALGIGLGVTAFGLFLCLLVAHGLFLADLVTTFNRTTGGNPLLQAFELLLNYYRFLAFDPWLLLGVIGLLLGPAARRGFLLSATAVLGLVVLAVRPVGPSLHTAVPLLPLLALGAGIAIDLGLRHLYRWLNTWLHQLLTVHERVTRLLATAIVFLVIVSPLGLAAASDTAELGSTLITPQDNILGTPANAQAVAHYIFAHAQNGTLVLASPEIAWLFDTPDTMPHTEGADLLQTIAQSGKGVAFYPAGLSASRWRYDVSLNHARYVIVDNLLRQLAAPNQIAALVPLLKQVEQWPSVFTSGQYTVYERPGAT